LHPSTEVRQRAFGLAEWLALADGLISLWLCVGVPTASKIFFGSGSGYSHGTQHARTCTVKRGTPWSGPWGDGRADVAECGGRMIDKFTRGHIF